jgi:hypothetical protein
MATGVVYYWNGESGWIKQNGAENIPTIHARDMMVLPVNVTSGTITRDCSVTFDYDDLCAFALNIAVG